MKTKYLAAALLLGVTLSPCVNAGPERDAAVAAAAPDSKASLGGICNAVYKAVKAEPDQAAEIYEDILAQRTNWKSGECSAIFRSILMARPDLGRNLSAYVRTYKGGKNGKDAPQAPDGMHPELYDMLNALYQASLEDGVPEQTVNEVMNFPDIPHHDDGAPSGFYPPFEILVTPDPVSPNR